EIVKRPRARTERMFRTPSNSNLSINVTEGHKMLHWTGASWVKRAARDFRARALKIPSHGWAEPKKVKVHNKPHKTGKWRINRTAYNLRKQGHGFSESFEEARRRMDIRSTLRRLAPHELSVDQCRLIG